MTDAERIVMNYDVDEAFEFSKANFMIKNSRRHIEDKLSREYE